jgi:hypothetical protein
VNRVIVIAPAGARWADRAAIALTLQGSHVARLPSSRFVAFMVVASGAEAILVDHRSLDPTWPRLRERLHVIDPTLRFVVVAEDGHTAEGAMPWPEEPAAAVAIVTGDR